MPVYLELFHGRPDPYQEMDDWGEKGPILGPFTYIHTTYGDVVNFGLPDETYINKAGEKVTKSQDVGIICTQGTIYYDGMYYGDWSVFDQAAADKCAEDPSEFRRFEKFDETKSKASVARNFTWHI